jgi:hypothetical protein
MMKKSKKLLFFSKNISFSKTKKLFLKILTFPPKTFPPKTFPEKTFGGKEILSVFHTFCPHTHIRFCVCVDDFLTFFENFKLLSV